MDRVTQQMRFGAAARPPVGQQEWTSAGTYPLIVPIGTSSMSAVCVNGGQNGSDGPGDEEARGGDGGNLRWISSFAVTAGETLTVDVGGVGGVTSIKRGATVLLSGNSVIGGNIGGGNGGPGGVYPAGPGGGGAGGYSGNGGKGGDFGGGGQNGTGGGGGGGGGFFNEALGPGGSGGGVGLRGEGASGIGGAGDFGPSGGSGSALGPTVGHGGGGGGANGSAQSGGSGGARVIWGQDRAYPSTRTEDQA